MAAGLFQHFSVEVLQSMLAGQVSQLAGNKIMVSYTENGVTRTKQFAMSHADFLHELNWALSHADPKTYGYNRARTRVSF
jgi:hypothetical protein